MTLAEAIKIVDSHQTWRTWKHEDGGPEMTNPRDLTVALDVLLSVCRGELRRLRDGRPPAPSSGIGAAMENLRSAKPSKPR